MAGLIGLALAFRAFLFAFNRLLCHCVLRRRRDSLPILLHISLFVLSAQRLDKWISYKMLFMGTTSEYMQNLRCFDARRVFRM